LAEFVRTGESVSRAESSSLDESDFHLEAAASEWIMTPAALDLIRVLGIGAQRRNLDVLELAAGSAIWSLAIAHHDPEGRLTVVDNPGPLAAARSHAQAIGLNDRITWIEEDYRSVELPAASFDLAILANSMNLETLEDSTAQFQKILRSLRPGGELAVVSVFPGQSEGALEHGLYRLAMALRTDAGRLHGPDQLQEALLQAGFEKPQFAHLPSPPHIMGLMLAAKGL
jgi:ubiquinone/menaquinone biosynthesis C-methylase UbiE